MEELDDLDMILNMQMDGLEYLDVMVTSNNSADFKTKIIPFEQMYITEGDLFENNIKNYVDYLINNNSFLWVDLSEILSCDEIINYVKKFIICVNKSNSKADMFILSEKLLSSKMICNLLKNNTNETNNDNNSNNNGDTAFILWDLLIGNLINHVNISSGDWETNIKKIQEIIKKLLRSDQLMKNNFMNWMAKIMNICVKKINLSSTEFDPALPSDYYLANFLGLMLTFWKEGLTPDRIKILDYNYIISDKCPIKWFDTKITNDTKDYNFITQCLFSILNLLRIGYYPILYRSQKWPDFLNEINRRIALYPKEQNPFIAPILNGLHSQKQIVKDHIDIDTEISNNATLKKSIHLFYTQLITFINNNPEKQFDDIFVDMSYILLNINKDGSEDLNINYGMDMFNLSLKIINSKSLTSNINTRCEFAKFFANVLVKTPCCVPDNLIEDGIMGEFAKSIIILHNDLHHAIIRPDYKYSKKILIHQTIDNIYISNPILKNVLLDQFSANENLTKKFINIILTDFIDFNDIIDKLYINYNMPNISNEEKIDLQYSIYSTTKYTFKIMSYLNSLIGIIISNIPLIKTIFTNEIMTTFAMVFNTAVTKLSINFKYDNTLGIINSDIETENLPDIKTYAKNIVGILNMMYLNECDLICIVDDYSFNINYYMELSATTSGFDNVLTELQNKMIELENLNSLENEDTPSEFIDPITLTLIKNPCLLPGMVGFSEGDVYFNKSTIMRQLLESEINPYTRTTLTIQEFEDFNNQQDILGKIKKFQENFNQWKKSVSETITKN